MDLEVKSSPDLVVGGYLENPGWAVMTLGASENVIPGR